MEETIANEDLTLVKQLKQGNHLAFTILYKKYASQAFALSFKYLCNKILAEDAVQNLFLKLWLKKEELREDIPVNRLLFTILKNDLLNILRDSKSDIFVLDDCLEVLNYIESDEDADNQDIDNEQLELIRTAINRLSPQRRKIFFLKMSGKYSNQEIADKMHLSVNTIKFQYSQSLKQLKEWVREITIMCLLAL
ncbi:RNA polymerase sigma factor [Bacteroides congonensis]|uniref:RNA polymerase sigma factor n=1 Tax=Bacteroides congonensis TaxID=1871006 RepID=UPI002FD941E2